MKNRKLILNQPRQNIPETKLLNLTRINLQEIKLQKLVHNENVSKEIIIKKFNQAFF